MLYIRNRYHEKNHKIQNNYEKELKQISKKNNIYFYSSEKIVSENSNYAPKGEHFSIDGYKNLSKLILSQIKNKNYNSVFKENN